MLHRTLTFGGQGADHFAREVLQANLRADGLLLPEELLEQGAALRKNGKASSRPLCRCAKVEQ